MSLRVADHLKLEVQEPWSGLPNLVLNPSGVGGVQGWQPASVAKPAGAYAAAVAADTPALWWRLAETGSLASAQASDASGNARHGTYGTSGQAAAAGLVPATPTNGAVSITGTAGGAVLAYDSTWMRGNYAAVEAWFSTTAVLDPDEAYIAGWWGTAGAHRRIAVSLDASGKARVQAYVQNLTAAVREVVWSAGPDLRDGAVHHIVGQYNGNVLELFVDGVRRGSLNTNAGLLFAHSNQLTVGRSPTGLATTSRFGGTLDEVAVYAAALPANRIAAHNTIGRQAAVTALYSISTTAVGPLAVGSLAAVIGPTPVATASYATAATVLTGAADRAKAWLRVDDIPAGVAIRFRHRYSTDSSGFSDWSDPLTAPGVLAGPTAVIAAGATVWLEVQIYRPDGNNLAAGTTVLFRDVAQVVGTAAEVAAQAHEATPPWVEVLASSTQITVTRSELQVGVLAMNLRDANLDPATDTLIRDGAPVRCYYQDGDGGIRPGGCMLFGKISNGKATYDLRTPGLDDRKRTSVDATVVDPVSTLAGVGRSSGVATVPELTAVLAGTGVPYLLNGGAGSDPSEAIVVAVNDQASALDQVVITRDSTSGYAWVTGCGWLSVVDATTAAADTDWSTPVLELDEDDYSDIDVDYDTDRCINTVTVQLVRISPATGETETVQLGPYVDEVSVRDNGTRPKTFTVQGMAEADVPAYAAAILATNAWPTRRVNSVTLPIRTAQELGDKAGLDLYDLVQVSNARAGLDQPHRIVSITHQITAERARTPEGVTRGKWFVTLGFAGEDQVAPPTLTPSPPPASTTLASLLCPVGKIDWFWCDPASPPAGWLVIDGTTFDPGVYPKLYARMGTNVLPNAVDRFVIGAGSKALGTIGGDPTKPIPLHDHAAGTLAAAANTDIVTRQGGSNANVPAPGHGHGVTGRTGAASGSEFDVMPPWIAFYACIRAV